MHNDVYTWCVIHRDGTTTNEFDDVRPDGRGFAEVDTTTATVLLLFPRDQCRQAHVVQIPTGAVPVFFRRRTVTINLNNDGEATPEQTKHCIGWKRGEEAVYLFVFDDDSTVLSTDLQAI